MQPSVERMSNENENEMTREENSIVNAGGIVHDEEMGRGRRTGEVEMVRGEGTR